VDPATEIIGIAKISKKGVYNAASTGNTPNNYRKFSQQL
jgi:hypothetical protein